MNCLTDADSITIAMKRNKTLWRDFFLLFLQFKFVSRTNEGPGTDYGTSVPWRGLKTTAPDGKNRQTDGTGNSMTESAQWDRVSEIK